MCVDTLVSSNGRVACITGSSNKQSSEYMIMGALNVMAEFLRLNYCRYLLNVPLGREHPSDENENSGNL
jgi:hypothetical protein